MGKHLRRLFSAEEVKEIGMEQVLGFLNIRRRQFFKLLKVYRESPDSFSLDYKRTAPPRQIDAKSEKRIIQELEKEARIIQDKSNPVKFYNYSYLKEIMEKKSLFRRFTIPRPYETLDDIFCYRIKRVSALTSHIAWPKSGSGVTINL